MVTLFDHDRDFKDFWLSSFVDKATGDLVEHVEGLVLEISQSVWTD